MRPHNSVGGYRIYPTSPAVAESVERGVAIIGQFNEAIDHLHAERQLTQAQQRRVDHLDPNSQLARNYQALRTVTNGLWQRALEFRELQIMDGQQITELSHHLNASANRWQGFKRQLDEQA